MTFKGDEEYLIPRREVSIEGWKGLYLIIS